MHHLTKVVIVGAPIPIYLALNVVKISGNVRKPFFCVFCTCYACGKNEKTNNYLSRIYAPSPQIGLGLIQIFDQPLFSRVLVRIKKLIKPICVIYVLENHPIVP